MMGSVLLSRVIGLVREMVMARYGGITSDMDAYVTAFIIPELLNHFLAGGFLSITFIPIFQRHLVSGRHDEAWRSFSNLFCMGTLLFVVIVPATMVAAPLIMQLLGPQIQNPQTCALTVKLTRIILPAQLFFYWGAFFSAVQMAQKKFFFPALAPLCYNGGIIVAGIILAPRLGIEGFAWGVCGGAFIGNVAIQVPGALRAGMKFTFVIDWRHPDVFRYIKKTIPLVLGLGMTFSNELFFRFFGTFLPAGSTASVNYALRTMMMLVAVFGQASGFAFYPYLTKLAAEKKFGEMADLLNMTLRSIAIYLLPLSAILALLSRQVISLLYERGRFDAQSTTETASIFIVYLAGSFVFSAALIIARSFYAQQKMVLPMAVSTIVSLLTIPLYLFFSSFLGGRGIALAAVVGMTLQCAVLYSVWCTRQGFWHKARAEAVVAGKIAAITLFALIIAWPLRETATSLIVFESSLLRNGVQAFVVAIPVLAVVFFLYDRLGVQRFGDSLQGLLRRR